MLGIFLYFINFCATKSWLSFWIFYVKILSLINHQRVITRISLLNIRRQDKNS